VDVDKFTRHGCFCRRGNLTAVPTDPPPKGQGGGDPASTSIIPLDAGSILVFVANWAREFAGVRFRLLFSLDGCLAYFRSMRMRGSYRSSSASSASSASVSSALGCLRAAAMVRRRIRLMGSRVVMLTLTAGGRRIRSWMEARRLMSGFVRVLRRRGMEGILGSSYVGVIEAHKDGCYHVHFACARGRFSQAELVLLRQVWTGYLLSEGYELSPGTCWHRVHVAVRSAKYVSGYLAKYLTKELEQEDDGRLKGVSRYIGSRDLANRVLDLDVEGFLRLLGTADRVEAYYLPEYEMVVGWCRWRDGPAQPNCA